VPSWKDGVKSARPNHPGESPKVDRSEIQTEVARAIRTNDRHTLRKYGRFLEPFSSVAQAQLSATHDEGKIDNAIRTVAAERATQPATCHAAPVTALATGYNRAP
jgi:hypothetical protein